MLITVDDVLGSVDDPLSRAVYGQLAHLLNVLAPPAGIDPRAAFALARLETGRDVVDELGSFNFWGVHGDWGPILSRRTADFWGAPGLIVDRDYFVESYDAGRPQKFRAYPTGVHSVADFLRMMNIPRYQTSLRGADQVEHWYRAGYSERASTAARARALFEDTFGAPRMAVRKISSSQIAHAPTAAGEGHRTSLYDDELSPHVGQGNGIRGKARPNAPDPGRLVVYLHGHRTNPGNAYDEQGIAVEVAEHGGTWLLPALERNASTSSLPRWTAAGVGRNWIARHAAAGGVDVRRPWTAVAHSGGGDALGRVLGPLRPNAVVLLEAPYGRASTWADYVRGGGVLLMVTSTSATSSKAAAVMRALGARPVNRSADYAGPEPGYGGVPGRALWIRTNDSHQGITRHAAAAVLLAERLVDLGA